MKKHLVKFILPFLAFLLIYAVVSYAARRPDIISYDAELLQNAVSINVKWQSEYPVVLVKVFAGNKSKEVTLDEYDDNIKDAHGYHGETSLIVDTGPIGYSDKYVSYIIQIKDDLGRKSRQVSGRVKVQQAGDREHEYREGEHAVREYVDKPPEEQPVGMIDKVLKVMERHDTPPVLKPLKTTNYGRKGFAVFTEAIDDKGLKEIKIRILDKSGQVVGEQTLSDLGKVWQGTSRTFSVKPGTYKVVAQAVDTGGNTSPERTREIVIAEAGGFLTVSIVPDAAITAGAEWRVDSGAWQKSGISVAGLSTGSHKVEFK
ncbi:MAG: hypothetical protein U9Q38_07115, partial [Thermodesulfobacteriota bacterium]|nr:hypothetical protein [Thermodesulfobacteriota bacterium]